MDGNFLDALRKVRQGYWDAMRCDNAVTEEQEREPKPRPCPKVADSAWIMGSTGFILAPILFVLSGLASCVGAKSSTVGSLGNWSVILLVFALVSLVMNSITKNKKKKTIETTYHNYLKVDFAKETQQWQDCLYEKQKTLDESMKIYCQHAALCSAILPPKYFAPNYEYYGKHPVVAITQYIEDLRADTIKEAINLYEADEREARRDYENNAHRSQMEQHAVAQTQAARLTQAYAAKAADAAERTADASKRTADASKRIVDASERTAAASERSASAEGKQEELLRNLNNRI